MLLLVASSSKPAQQLDGLPYFYSAGRKSLVGGTTLKPYCQQSTITASVACLAVARGVKPTAEELQAWHTNTTNLKFALPEAWNNMPAQTVPEVPVEVDDSPDIMGELLSGPSPEGERQGLRRAREEVSSKDNCEEYTEEYRHQSKKRTNHSAYVVDFTPHLLPASHLQMFSMHSVQPRNFGAFKTAKGSSISLGDYNNGLDAYRLWNLKPGRSWHWKTIAEHRLQIHALLGKLQRPPCLEALWSTTMRCLTRKRMMGPEGHQ